jgi:hypothetical protein
MRLGEVSKAIRSAAAPGYWRQDVHKESVRNTGSPEAWSAIDQLEAREGQADSGMAAQTSLASSVMSALRTLETGQFFSASVAI